MDQSSKRMRAVTSTEESADLCTNTVLPTTSCPPAHHEEQPLGSYVPAENISYTQTVEPSESPIMEEVQTEPALSSPCATLECTSEKEVGLPSSLVENDLGKYDADAVRLLSDEQRYWLLNNTFKPGIDYTFPSKVEYTKSRAFQHRWIKTFPWFVYSKTCNAGLCLLCAFFQRIGLMLVSLLRAQW